MVIEKKAFISYDEDSDKKRRDIITVSLNDLNREQLEWAKRLMQQPKDGTALKTLAFSVGTKVLQGDSPYVIIAELFKNMQRNNRTGVPIDSPYFVQK